MRQSALKLYLSALEKSRGVEPGDSYGTKVEKYYDSIAEVVLPSFGLTFQVATASEDSRESNLFFGERASMSDGLKVLDAGCGWGGPALHFAEAFPALALSAVSLSGKQCTVLEKEAELRGLSTRLSVHHADYHALPFQSEQFDLVYFLESSGHSEAPVSLFSEIFRILRPGGKIYLKEPFLQRMESGDAVEAVERIFCHKLSTMEQAVSWLEAAGFQGVEARDISTLVDTRRFFHLMRDPNGNLTPFGKGHTFPYPPLDILIGDITARRPG